MLFKIFQKRLFYGKSYFKSSDDFLLVIYWNNTSYAIRDKSTYDRKQITFEDWRANFGSTYLLSDGFHLVGELGYVFNRTVEFERVAEGEDSNVNIDSTPYIRIGIAGPF